MDHCEMSIISDVTGLKSRKGAKKLAYTKERISKVMTIV